MKSVNLNLNLVCVWMLLLCLGSVQTTLAGGIRPLRLMSYNTHHSEGMDKVLDVNRICNIIKLQNPDILALQELDSMTDRTGKVYQLAEMAKKTKLHATFASALHNYRGGSYGNGILSKEKPLSVKRIALPGREQRILLVAEFKDFVFACTHLDGLEENLAASHRIILEESSNWNKPFFIAGDWNCRPDSRFIASMKENFKIVTYENSVPFEHPTYCIDYIAVRDDKSQVSTVCKWTVAGSNASDHCPVCAVVNLAIPDKNNP